MDDNGYKTKELHEMLIELKFAMEGMRGDLRLTQCELKATQDAMKKYNSLRDQITTARMRIQELENRAHGRGAVWDGIRQWGGWLVAIIALLQKWL